MTANALPVRHWRAELALASVALIWGSTFVLVKSALDDVSAALFVALRFSIATGVIAAVLVWRRGRHFGDGRSYKGGILAGVFLYAGYLLQTIGLRYTSPAKSGFLTGLYVVLVPLLTAALYRRSPAISEWIGVVFAAVGIGLMTLNTTSLSISTGDFLTLACAFAFSFHILVLGRYSPSTDAGWLALLQIGTCAAIACASFGFIETPAIRWRPAVVAALLITSLLATALAFFVQTWGQRHTTATRAALIFALEPVFAAITSLLAAGEVLTGRVLAGAACILAGILFAELKPIRSPSHPWT